MKKCITVFGAAALTVWTAAAQQEVPKGGVFLGYNYVRFNSESSLPPAVNANGGGGQFMYNFNNWISGVVDVGAVHNGNVGVFNFDSTALNFLAGPRVSFRHGRVTPYIQTLFGGVYGTTSTEITGIVLDPFLVVRPGDAVTARISSSHTKFAMTAGGGLDIKIGRRVSFRPIAVDYYMTRLQDPRSPGDRLLNNLRASAGFMFMFGGERPTPPPPPAPPHPTTKTCPDGTTVSVNAACPKHDMTLALNATSAELCPGDTTQVIPSISGANPNQLAYAWTVNGQPISQGPTFEFGSAGKDPGTYKVGLGVQGNNFNPASAETIITVKEYQPPTGTAQANPAQIQAGEKSSLSANFQGQCGGAIGAPTFEASEGSVQGDQFDSTGVQFDASNNAEQRKTVTITAKAADNKSVGTATTTIDVVKSAVVAAIRLPDVLFTQNSARVNNCGKRVLLEQLRAYAERDATGTVVLVGHTSSDETAANLAEHRAMNAAAVITAGTGVCLSIPAAQVQVSAPGADQNGVPFESSFCQSSVGSSSQASMMRRVEVWFVPTGGQIPSSVTKSQSAATLPISSLGCPK